MTGNDFSTECVYRIHSRLLELIEYSCNVELGEQLKENPITIYTKAGEGGRLFGSITSKEIASEIKKQQDVDIDKRKILLNDPIKTLGSTLVEIKLHQRVTTKVQVVVLEKK